METNTSRIARSLFVVIGAAIAIAGALLPWYLVRAVTCNVPTGYATIQAAIDDPACDTIVVAAGDYTENLVITRSVTIQGAGPGWNPGANVTRIQGGYADRVIHLYKPGYTQPTPIVHLSNLTIMEGSVTGYGGGVYNDSAVLTLDNVYLFENYASLGGEQLYAYGWAETTVQNSQLLLAHSGESIRYIAAYGRLTITHSVVAGMGDGLSTVQRAIYTLSPLTVQDSEIYGHNTGIYAERTVITIENSMLHDNYYSGVIFYEGASGVIASSQILTTVVPAAVGGAAQYGAVQLLGTVTVTVQNSTIGGSQSLDAYKSISGIYANDLGGPGGTLTVTNSLIQNNQGNGLWFLGGETLAIEGSEIRDNGGAGLTVSNLSGDVRVRDTTVASNGGQGLHLDNLGGRVVVRRSTVMYNSSLGQGGGVYLSDADLLLVNSTVAQNDADGDGGGIYVAGTGTADVINVTLARNTADADNDANGAGGGYYVAASGVMTLTNTLVAANTLGNGVWSDCSGSIVSLSVNLIRVADGCSGFSAADLTGSALSPLNAYLGALGDHGGATWTIPIPANSPAADAGLDSACNAPPVNGKDQREYGRANEDGNNDGGADGNACDIGAYERSNTAPTPTPTPTGTATPTPTPAPTGTAGRPPPRPAPTGAGPTPTPTPTPTGAHATHPPPTPTGTAFHAHPHRLCAHTGNGHRTPDALRPPARHTPTPTPIAHRHLADAHPPRLRPTGNTATPRPPRLRSSPAALCHAHPHRLRLHRHGRPPLAHAHAHAHRHGHAHPAPCPPARPRPPHACAHRHGRAHPHAQPTGTATPTPTPAPTWHGPRAHPQCPRPPARPPPPPRLRPRHGPTPTPRPPARPPHPRLVPTGTATPTPTPAPTGTATPTPTPTPTGTATPTPRPRPPARPRPPHACAHRHGHAHPHAHAHRHGHAHPHACAHRHGHAHPHAHADRHTRTHRNPHARLPAVPTAHPAVSGKGKPSLVKAAISCTMNLRVVARFD
ncbi:MAG: right-handed parallel beta-helix repeat-containing protein [Ardenticatenia bacterium]|nr:right-handed parallel beta-helix repeat-containing protein [Ardenticatenia bacterium]